ncbi:MAG: MAPEG family protein [Oleiphilaceae bacterium]|nr:MAPEG family protein [Oleiphilaceae bacterium]
MLAPITPLYAVVLVVIKLLLVWRVVQLRQRHNIGLGEGQHRELQVAVRAHGNYMEAMPLMLILLFMAEMNGVATAVLHGVGLVFVASRIAHAVGMVQGRGRYAPNRALGVVGTWLALLTLCGFLLHNVYQAGIY